MSGAHDHHGHDHGDTGSSNDPAYRRVLWFALVANLAMFVVELVASTLSGSVSLLADSIDFFGDAGNYAISLAVLGLSLRARARTALFKAACMAGFGAFVLGDAAWHAIRGEPPEPLTMGVVGVLALLVNVAVALSLYRWRRGDANMRSVWVCSRNDAIGNAAVVVAALGVFGTATRWPDLIVAAAMGVLALAGALTVVRQAREELRPA